MIYLVFFVLIVFPYIFANSISYTIIPPSGTFQSNTMNCSVVYIPYPGLNYSVVSGTNCNRIFIPKIGSTQNNSPITLIQNETIYIVTPSIITDFPTNSNIKISSLNVTYSSPLPTADVFIRSNVKLAPFRRYWYVGYENLIFYEPIPYIENYIFLLDYYYKPYGLYAFSYKLPYNVSFYTYHQYLDSTASIPFNTTCSAIYRLGYMVRSNGSELINHTTSFFLFTFNGTTFNLSYGCPYSAVYNTSFNFVSPNIPTYSLGFFDHSFTNNISAVYNIAFNITYSNLSLHKSDPITPIVIFKAVHNWNDTLYKYWIVEDPTGRCWFGEYVPSSKQIIATMPVQCNTNASQSSSVQFYNYTVNYNNTCKFSYNNTHVVLNYTHLQSNSVRVIKINKNGSIVTNVTLSTNAQLIFNRETDFVLGVYTNTYDRVLCYYREQYTNMNNNVQKFFHLLFILLTSAVPLSVLFTIPAYAIGIFSNIPVFTIIHALSLASLVYFFTRGQFHMFSLPIFLIITSILVDYNIVLPSPPSSWGVVETLFALPITLINFIIELFRLPYSLVMYVFNTLPAEFSSFEWLAQTLGIAINTYFVLYAFTIIYNRFQR